MAYQVLARKWRPSRFDDVVGQTYAVRALSYALNQQKLHSAYLLAGSHGVGKTSLARIIARAINCEQGISANPCDKCPACLSLLQGQALDVIEIDAASRTKVEDTRDLLDNVQYAPTHCRYKIYIIDEVHMLSTHSFNALLKTLEEPPAHVLFLLATTHPDKLPVTVRSRCLQFHLRPIQTQEITQQLKRITEAEQLLAEPAALNAIAQAARGSMRDALSLLDQAIAVGQGQVTTTETVAMLGLADEQTLDDFITALAEANLLALVTTIRQAPLTVANLPQQWLFLCQQAALYQKQEALHTADLPQAKLIKRVATSFSQEQLQLYYQLTLHAIADMNKAPDALMAAEMWLLRLVHFDLSPQEPIQTQKTPVIAPKTAAVPQAQAASAALTKTSSAPIATPLPTPSVAEPSTIAPKVLVPFSDTTPTVTLTPPSVSIAETAPATTPEPVPATTINTVHPAWAELMLQLNLTGMIRIIAEQADLYWKTPTHAVLVINKAQASLCQPPHPQTLEQALSDYLSTAVTLTVEYSNDSVNSPMSLAATQQKQAHAKALTTLQQDPHLQAILKTFDATIDEASVTLTTSTS